MLEHINIQNILFLDIETVPIQPTFEQLPEKYQALWKLKARQVLRKYDEELTTEEVVQAYERAGIYAEFGKIVCISVGYVASRDGQLSMRLKSFADEDEKTLLVEFSDLIATHYNNPNQYFFCGHNIKEFDIPYLCRRMVIYGLKLPRPLDISGKKPWETKHLLDTLELWKFGDYKHYTSLSLLTTLFDIPTPKDDIDGSDVSRVFWEEQDLARIAIYCEKDVVAVIQLFLKFQGQDLISEKNILKRS